MQVHRDLHPLPLDAALTALLGGAPGTHVVTMNTGQWDTLLSTAYEQGWILLELDDDERPVRAYQRASTHQGVVRSEELEGEGTPHG